MRMTSCLSRILILIRVSHALGSGLGAMGGNEGVGPASHGGPVL
jgi:hypothetical protein